MLNFLIFSLAAIILLVSCVLLIHSLVRGYRRPADSPETARALPTSLPLEVLWTLLPVGLLVVLLIMTYQAL